MTEKKGLNKAIGIGAALYGVSILLSRLVGLIRESVIGRTLGNHGEADVYWAAFVLPDFLNYLLAGGVLSIVFIPIFQGYLARKDEAGAWRAFSIIGNTLFLILTVATTLLWFAVPQLTPMVAPGFDSDQLLLLNRLVRIILPAQVFHLVGGLLSATLQARDQHLMPAMAPVVYTSSIVIGGLLLAPSMGAEGFAWGVLVGSFLGPFCCPLLGTLRSGLIWTLTFELRHPDLRTYVLLALPVMLGFSVVVLDDMVTKHFASELSEGVLSRLQYARTLMKVPMGVFGLAMGMAAFPTLSRLFAQGETDSAWAVLIRALRLLLVLSFLAQAGLMACAAEMAEVIWGVTRFSKSELAEIGLFTGFLSIGLWAWASQSLVARGFYAQGDTWTPTLIGSVVLLPALPIYSLLAERFHGLGLTMASSIIIIIYVGLLFGRLQRMVKPQVPAVGRLLSLLIILITVTLVGVVCAWSARAHLVDLPALLRGFLTGSLAVTISVAGLMIARVEEATLLMNKIRKRAGL